MNDNVSGMNPVAKMGFVPRGIYDNTAAYDFLDFVYYNGNSYVAKKLTVGNEPRESNEYWQILAKGGIEDVGIQFQGATERKNIQSGEDAPTLFGKIKKWFVDLKEVAWSGDYIDLSNKPTIPAAVAVKGNAESTYRTGNVNLTPANIGAVATTKVLTTKEQINANTDTSNVAGATAVKAITSEINSNINKKSEGFIKWGGDCNGLGFGTYLANSSANTPTANAWHMVISTYQDGTGVQLAIPLIDGVNIYVRMCSGGNWSTWKNLLTAKAINVTLQYKSSTEMYAEIKKAGYYPISFVIHEQKQTPYDAVKYTTVTHIGDTIKCLAVGSGFVDGHLLSATIYCI